MTLHVHRWPHNPTPFTNTRNMKSRLRKQHRQYPPHSLPVAVWAGTSHPLPNHGRSARHRLLVEKRYQGRIVVIRRVRRMRVLTHPPRAVHRTVRSRRTPRGPSPFPNREATRERRMKMLSKIWVRHSMPSLGCVVLLMLSIFEWIRRNPEWMDVHNATHWWEDNLRLVEIISIKSWEIGIHPSPSLLHWIRTHLPLHSYV